jgi:hypothetical protein
MPRQAKKPSSRVPDQKVTEAEVDTMFRAATKRGPWPSPEFCKHLAEGMNNNLGHEIEPRDAQEQKAEARKASDTLRTYIRSVIENTPLVDTTKTRYRDLFDLLLCLQKNEGYFWPRNSPDWELMALLIAEQVGDVFSEMGRPVGRSRTSALVKFVRLALTRLGYAGVTDIVLEMHFQERKWVYGKYPRHAN